MIFIVLVVEGLHVVDKYLFKIIVDDGSLFLAGALDKTAFIGTLKIILYVFLGIIVFKIASKWIHLHIMNKMESLMILDLKQKFFNHIIHLSHNFHTTHKTGSLIARLGRGAGALERTTDFLIFNTFPLIFQIIIMGASLAYFDILTALVVVITAAVFVFYSLFILHLQRSATIRANETEDIEKANIADIFTNIDSIKYFGKEATIKGKFAKLSNDSREAQLKHWDYYRWLDSGHSLILAIGTLFLIYFPLMKFLDGQLSIGTLVFIYTVYGNIFGPLFGFVHGIRGFYRSMSDFDDLFQYEKIKNEIEDRPNAKSLQVKEGQIEFNNITFKYNNRKIFSDFNLKIKRNEKVALVGHSGSGKTTLVKLLYRLYDLQKGEILIDGRDIRDFRQESVRQELSIVPQECVLFDDTVYNNILFSRPDATREEVLKAIKFAQLDKIVDKFSDKENTLVGQRGIKLSGGERQRVSIARAILANKKILVLDEATSSLDSETEHEIQKDLENLLENRTSIIIAHRLSTIMNADKIVVLDGGKITQIGNHKDLISKKGVYKKLWDLQRGGYLG